ncbi:MAG TPA: PqqD family protein [Verrucomicrobiae bacterium]|nr:PqqD family protein [Verrucomicrobiae bacterium]
MRPVAGALIQQVGEDLALFHPAIPRVFVLNSVGADIWRLLNAGCDKPAIVQHLLNLYDTDPATLQIDVSKIISDLQVAGLLTEPEAEF